MPRGDADIVHKGFAAASRGDVDAVAALLAEDVYWGAEGGGGCHNREQTLRWMREGFARGIRVEVVVEALVLLLVVRLRVRLRLEHRKPALARRAFVDVVAERRHVTEGRQLRESLDLDLPDPLSESIPRVLDAVRLALDGHPPRPTG